MYKKMILGLVLMGSLAGCHAKAEVNFPAVSARTLSFITGNAEVNAVFYGLGSTFCLLQAAGLSCSSLLDENLNIITPKECIVGTKLLQSYPDSNEFNSSITS
jgi:hypothetical protein